MEITTLQQRIEEKAEKKLLIDLRDATTREQENQNLIGRELYPMRLEVKDHVNYNYKTEIVMYNDFSKEVFKLLLPQYIKNVTEDFLRQIDEIDYFLKNNPDHKFEDLP